MALIVAVDDDPDLTDLFTETLESYGHTVKTAGDGPSALDLICEVKPDLAILDHHMPGMTGLQVAELLRGDAATFTLPLLMLSAAAPSRALLSCNVVLSKPISLRRLRHVVDTLTTPAVAVDALTDPARLQAVGTALGAHTVRAGAQLNAFARDVAMQVGADMAAVNLMLADAAAVCGSYGLPGWIGEAGGVPAEWTPCSTVVRNTVPVLIHDTRADTSQLDNPLVATVGVRSYAGVPLLDSTGQTLGTLCVLHRQSHAFTNNTLGVLGAKAHQALECFNL